MGTSLAEAFDSECIRDKKITHLGGVVIEDTAWQDRHKGITTHSLLQCDLSGSPLGRLFVRTLEV